MGAKTMDDNVKWVLQAIDSTDTPRPELTVAKVNNCRLVATDGKRLHILENYLDHWDGAILPDGSWISEAQFKKDYRQYPDYEKCIPENLTPLEYHFFSANQKHKHLTNFQLGKKFVQLDKEYVKQAILGISEPNFYCNGVDQPFVIEGGDLRAIIMPWFLKGG